MPDFKQETDKLLDEAIALSKKSHVELEKDYDFHFPKWVQRTDKLILAPHQLTGTQIDEEVVEAGQKFLDSAMLFERASAWEMAAKARFWSWKMYNQLPGNEFREREAGSLHRIGYSYLSIEEVTSEESEVADYNRRAADYFVRAAWVWEGIGNFAEARSEMNSASYRYDKAHTMNGSIEVLEMSAYAAYAEAELSEKIGENHRAAEVFELAAKRYSKVGSSSEVADWYQKAAYLHKKQDTYQSKKYAFRAFQQAINTRLDDEHPELSKVTDDLREAIELAKTLGRYNKLDELRYQFHTIRQQLAAKEQRRGFVSLSLVNDWSWGYGTRPYRLLRLVFVTVLSFALLYSICQEIQPNTAHIKPRTLTYTFFCLGYSIYEILPTGVIDWLTGAGLIFEFQVSGISKWLSAIESLFGVVFLAMFMAIANRIRQRLFLEKAE